MNLAIDIGLNMGWAYGNDMKLLDHGVVKLDKKWGYNAATRLFSILHNFKTKIGVDKVYCEKVGGGYYNSNIALMGMTGIIQLVYKDLTSFAPTSIKKYWVGTGRADKSDMLKITHMSYPEVMDHNESDAIAIWYYGREYDKNI